MKKRLISIVVLLCMTLGVFSVMPFYVSADDGTVTIGSVDDWMEKLSGKTVGNANIVVTARELDFDGKTVEPVQGFSGYFDGKGVVIKNMTVTLKRVSGTLCLFGREITARQSVFLPIKKQHRAFILNFAKCSMLFPIDL